MKNLPKYITASEAREILGISEATLKRRLSDPEFPQPIRMTPGPSGHRRFIESDLHDWMASRREEVAG